MLKALQLQMAGNELAEEKLHGTSGHEHATCGLLVCTGLDGLGYKRHPGVEDAIFQTTEWLTKGHVANDVERGEI